MHKSNERTSPLECGVQSAECGLFRFISTTPTVRSQQTNAGYESMQFYRAVAR
jgi:hypothetical protein